MKYHVAKNKFTFLLFILTLLRVESAFYCQNSDYIVLEERYKNYISETNLDSALFYAKQMNAWAFKNEGDTSLRYAVSFRYIGNCFDELGTIDSTLFYWNESLTILKKQKRSKSIEAANCSFNLAFAYYNLEEYFLAIEYCQNFTKIYKEINGENNKEYYDALSDIGAFYRVIGDYKKSEQYLLESLKIKSKVVGENNLDYAYSLINLSNLYADLDKLDKSLEYCTQSINIIQKNIGKENEDFLVALNNRAGIFYQMGEYEIAKSQYLDLLGSISKLKGEINEDYARCLGNLGTVYSTNNDFFEAKRLLIKSSDIYRLVLGERHYLYARSLISILDVIYESADYQTLKFYCSEAIDIYKESLGNKHPEYAYGLVKLGQINSKFGNYKDAEICYNQALEIYKTSYSDLHGDISWVLGLQGNLNIELANFEAAKSKHQEALSIIEKIYGNSNSHYAIGIYNLARVYFQIDDYYNANYYFKLALKINKNLFGKKHSYYAASLNSLGVVYTEKKDFKKAIPLFKKSLRIYSKVHGNNHEDVAMIKNNLGITYAQIGKNEIAESLFKDAAAIRKNVLGYEHTDFISSIENLADFYWKIKDFNQALENFNNAFPLKAKKISENLHWLSTIEKKCFWQQEKEFYEKINEFTFDFNGAFESTKLSFNSNLLSKSLLLETSRELDHAISNSSDQLLKDQFNEMKQLRRLINKIQSEGSDKKEIIDHYNSKADSLDKILVNKVGEYANAKRKFEITWKDVQMSLLTTDAAIEFARYYDYKDSTYKYMALVIRPEYEYPKLVKLGSELNIKNASSQREFSDLYKFVWVGIDSLLTGVKTIYYSPVGELNNVSFSALVSENKNQSDSSKSNWSYLIDRYDLHQVTTTRYLADGTLNRNDSLPLSIKLIGGVNYSDLPLSKDSLEENETTEDFALQINLQNEMNDSKSNRGGKISYLKGSEIEVKEIAKTLKKSGWETTISDGKNAGEYQFKEELKEKSPGIIHIATHGFAFPEKETKEENGFQMKETATYKVSEDPMVRCGLMLSGANISWSGDSKKMIETSGDDGILTAAEVANLDLSNTKLVVLSACETGLGKIESSEGTFGLKRGFKLAGVDHIIVSLWKIPDNETMELMTLFYSELSKTQDIEISFNKAQREMRNRYPYEPEKWAGFVLVR